MRSLQNIPFLWKANDWRSKSCHFPVLTLFWIAPKLTMRKWWPLYILWITLSTSWALMWFSSALAILSVGSVFTFPLAAFYPESHWPLSALKQGGVQLGCLGSCCEYVRRKSDITHRARFADSLKHHLYKRGHQHLCVLSSLGHHFLS